MEDKQKRKVKGKHGLIREKGKRKKEKGEKGKGGRKWGRGEWEGL